jgi:glutamyl-tRNA reductase
MVPHKITVFVIGLNFKTANLEELEKASLDSKELMPVLENLKASARLDEVILLSTCNRIEVYGRTNCYEESIAALENFLKYRTEISAERLSCILDVSCNEKAVDHLFRVVTSIDSMVIGEPQILGQVKEAYQIAKSLGCTGEIFDRLFPKAFQLAKKVRTDTGLGKNSVSIASVAVQLAQRLLSDLSEKMVLLVGAGEMAEQSALNLSKHGIKKIYVFNRSKDRVIKLSNKIDVIPIYDLDQALVMADIVISSTSSECYVINKKDIMNAMNFREGRPLFFIDLAVPRDIDPGIRDIENAHLFNIDDLKEIAENSKGERKKAANQAEAFIKREVSFFFTWLNTLEVKPLIENLKTKIEILCKYEIDESMKKLGHKDVNDQLSEWFAKSLTKKILHDPITILKQNVANGKDHYIELTRLLFKLD